MRPALISLAIVLSSPAGVAMAEDPIPAEVSQCLGAYGALADQAPAMSSWSSALGRSNLTKIDWAARRTKLLEAEDQGVGIYAASSGLYVNAYVMWLTADRINHTAADTAAILELSVRCDQAFHFSPSFAIPPAS
ncbi:MAG: hypothetical protein HY859_13490 [Caulobacterales bacterium]|nr:hypothetical protein [Caulobacterales bacterium]